ncbi:MAG: hypothetical protein H7841_02160 [Magnetospirillum sp. WYHS-4]
MGRKVIPDRLAQKFRFDRLVGMTKHVPDVGQAPPCDSRMLIFDVVAKVPARFRHDFKLPFHSPVDKGIRFEGIQGLGLEIFVDTGKGFRHVFEPEADRTNGHQNIRSDSATIRSLRRG